MSANICTQQQLLLPLLFATHKYNAKKAYKTTKQSFALTIGQENEIEGETKWEKVK